MPIAGFINNRNIPNLLCYFQHNVPFHSPYFSLYLVLFVETMFSLFHYMYHDLVYHRHVPCFQFGCMFQVLYI